MYSLFLIAFVVCFLYNYYNEGGTFVAFSRAVELINSVREPTPRRAKQLNDALLVEYKFGKRLYGLIIPKEEPLTWYEAAAFVGGEWIDRTKEIEFYGGPWRNFYNQLITPAHINISYIKLAFRFREGIVIHVLPNESIITKLNKKKELLQQCNITNANKSK